MKIKVTSYILEASNLQNMNKFFPNQWDLQKKNDLFNLEWTSQLDGTIESMKVKLEPSKEVN